MRQSGQVDDGGLFAGHHIHRGSGEGRCRQVAAEYGDRQGQHRRIDDLHGAAAVTLAVDRGECDRSRTGIIVRRGESECLIVRVQVSIRGFGGAHRIQAVHISGLAGADAYMVGDADDDRFAGVHDQRRRLRAQRRRKDAVCRHLDESGGCDVLHGVRHRIRHGTRVIGQIHGDHG